MQHRLVRRTTNTYNGGNYLYVHYTRNSIADDWTRDDGVIYARSIKEAREKIRANQESELEWED